MPRGKFRSEIDNRELLNYLETHGIKEAADYFNAPLTTIYSRLEQLDYFPIDKNVSIELTPENKEYIETHTLTDGCKHFHKGLPAYRSFLNRYHLTYLKVRDVSPAVEKRKQICYQKNLQRQKEFIELHKTMTYEEIGKIYNLSKASVCDIIRGRFGGL